MGFLDDVKKNVTTAGRVASDKAKKTADVLKLRDQIRRDKKEIRNQTYKIGRMYIKLHEEDYEEDYEEFFAAIEAAKEDIVAKEQELDLLNLKKKCPECGAEMTGMDEKCPNCGAPAAYETELKEEEAVDTDDDAEESDFVDADFEEASDD